MSEETAKIKMGEKTKTGLEILEAALLLGILGDVLFRSTPFGLNVFLWTVVLVAAMVALTLRRRNDLWNVQTISLHVALIFFAGMFVWRDSVQLQLLDGFVIFTILAILILPALKIKTQLAGISHYIFGWIWAGTNAAFSPFFLVFDDIKWKKIPQAGWTKHLISVMRGVAIVTPILLIFGALFMAADAVFEGIIQKTFRISPDVLVGHLFFIGFFSWIVAGYLRGNLLVGSEAEINLETPLRAQPVSVTELPESETEAPKNEAPKPDQGKKWDWQNLNNSFLPNYLTLGAIEICVILGLINLLFLSFVIVQIPYLFGGFELVQQTADLKLANYARRGFGELVTVVALVLPILLTAHWLLKRDSPLTEKLYRVFAAIQIGLLFVIMISAMQRLFILTGNLGYGMSVIRFYPMVFMIWLGVVFVWFCATVLRGFRSHFAWGALWSGLIVLAVLHFVNPDALIVRTNARLTQEGRSFDTYYNTNLSDDAVPALLDSLPQMSVENQCHVKSALKNRFYNRKYETDFRSFNFSRWSLMRTWQENVELFDTTNCPANTLTTSRRDYDNFD